MSRALVGVLLEGPADPGQADAPKPIAATRTAAATAVAISPGVGTDGRAACAAGPLGRPVTV